MTRGKTEVAYILGHAGWVDYVQLSEAGEYGSQSLTPQRDMEYLVKGYAIEQTEGFPILPSGAITPAFFMRLLASEIKAAGGSMKLHLYNMGCPDFLKHLSFCGGLADVSVYDLTFATRLIGSQKRRVKNDFFEMAGGEKSHEFVLEAIERHALPEIRADRVLEGAKDLARKMASYLVDEGEDKGDFVVSECVPGGTLLANAWLAASSGWQGVYSGSLNPKTNQSIIKTKGILVDGVTEALRHKYFPDGNFNSPHQEYLRHMDVLMFTLIPAMTSCFDLLKTPYFRLGAIHNRQEAARRRSLPPLLCRTRGKIILAGGVQMASILALASRLFDEDLLQRCGRTVSDFFEVHTTSAVANTLVSRFDAPDVPLKEAISLAFPDDLDWMGQVEQTKGYLQGFVGEGCGAGYAMGRLQGVDGIVQKAKSLIEGDLRRGIL